MRSFPAVVVAAAAWLSVSACTDAGSSFVIMQNQIPEGCVPPANVGDFRPRGRIDVQSGGGYLFFPVARSLVSSEGSAPHLIQVHGADVDIEFQPGFFEEGDITDDLQRLLSFSQRFSGVIQPGATTSFAFEILPHDLLDAIKATGKLRTDGTNQVSVLATVQMFGTLDGGDVSAEPYEYVVDVCDGCMLRVVDQCTDLPEGFVASPGGECNPLQDVPLDCCIEPDGGTLCPAVRITQ